MKLAEVVDLLEIELSTTAEWRRARSIEYPDDRRNVEAAEILDRLARTVKQVDPAMLAAYAALFDDLQDSERKSELLRQIGFHWWPETATEFVSRFISERSGKSG
jgi:hypothetical protein